MLITTNNLNLFNFIAPWIRISPKRELYIKSHVNTPTFNIGKTQMGTNQLGYVEMGEHRTFKLDAIIKI